MKIIETGHKTFDQQTDYIGSGNVCATTQTSLFIRAATETECNGKQFQVGHLREWDLNQPLFKSLGCWHKKRLMEFTDTRPGCFYRFRHFSKGREIINGFVLLDRAGNVIFKDYSNYRAKTIRIIDTCADFVANETVKTNLMAAQFAARNKAA